MALKPSGILVFAASILILPGLAFAQAAGTNYLTVSSTPSTNVYAPGTTDAALGTITLAASQPGSYQVSALPLTLITNASASAANLSECQLVNSAGSPLNTNANVINSVNAGTNTLMFDTPLTVTYGSPQTLTVRCTISSGTTSGSTFAFVPGSPMLAPSLMATMTVFPSVTPGEANAPVAAITLNPSASGSNLDIYSIPLSVTYQNALTQNDLSNCQLADNGTTLTANGSGTLTAGANALTLATPLVLTGGSGASALMLSCNVSSVAPIGSSIALSLAPSGILAANASGGASVIPTQGTDPSTGIAGSLGGTASVVAPSSTSITTTTVTAPNTGAGAGAPLTLALMLAAGLVALAGIGYFARELYAK